MEKLNLEKIKEIVVDFFSKMGFSVTLTLEEKEPNVFLLSIKTDNPKLLIGSSGKTLIEIQHLLRLILMRQLKIDSRSQFYLELDINHYQKKKKEFLKDLALNLADEVALTKKEKVMPFLSAYERRIVHLILAERTDIIQESVGQGKERRIVIRPKNP
jgi:spoIIIJ-associated protein